MEQNERDVLSMRQALICAERAAAAGEVPVGALVVSPYGDILGEGENAVEAEHSQAEHAEVRAIRAAGSMQGDWRLDGCTLYVTLEPCMMCVSLIALSRIERIVYGASSPRFGFSLDKEAILRLYTKQIKSIVAGVCKNDAVALLERSFVRIRE